MLGLIFVKSISDTFSAKRTELSERFADPTDDYFLVDGAPEQTADVVEAEVEDRDCYREVNVFWVPEAARWEALRAAAKQPDIGRRIDEALSLIESENPKLKGILDKLFARAQLPDGKLGELVDLVSTIGFGAAFEKSASEARDVLGQVYEPIFLSCPWPKERIGRVRAGCGVIEGGWHPRGEHQIRGEAMHVRTPAGVVEVRRDERGTATAMGQLAFFAEYLEATGLSKAGFERAR